jgi:hypothetical protein
MSFESSSKLVYNEKYLMQFVVLTIFCIVDYAKIIIDHLILPVVVSAEFLFLRYTAGLCFLRKVTCNLMVVFKSFRNMCHGFAAIDLCVTSFVDCLCRLLAH